MAINHRLRGQRPALPARLHDQVSRHLRAASPADRRFTSCARKSAIIDSGKTRSACGAAAAGMPKITEEGIEAGQQWGQGLGPKILDRLQARFSADGIPLGP